MVVMLPMKRQKRNFRIGIFLKIILMAMFFLHLLGLLIQMNLAYTICQAMYGNGAVIGMTPITALL